LIRFIPIPPLASPHGSEHFGEESAFLATEI
jgi:hypothetical protein